MIPSNKPLKFFKTQKTTTRKLKVSNRKIPKFRKFVKGLKNKTNNFGKVQMSRFSRLPILKEITACLKSY